MTFCTGHSVKAHTINDALTAMGTAPLAKGCKLIDLIARPQLSIASLAPHIPALSHLLDTLTHDREEIVEAVEIGIKYKGYIVRERELAEKMRRLEDIHIQGRIDYEQVLALSTEARQKLKQIDPETLGQASRISGVSPSDVSVLMVLMGR